MRDHTTRIRQLLTQPAIRPNEKVFLGLVAIGGLVMAGAPAWASAYGLLALRDAIIFSVFALSCDLLWGKARTLTLGHGTFFGLGAYGFAITNTTFGMESVEGILAGVACAAALALVIGYFLIFAGVRLHFFAIITIAILLIVGQVVNSWSTLTGGDVGILGIPGLRFSLLGLSADLSGEISSYYFALGFLVVSLLAVWTICRGSYGMVLNAIGMNEFRARALGYNTSLYMLVVFVVSAALAGMSGTIFAATTGVVAPDLFSPLLSTQVILWVAVGGRGTLIGPVFATIILSRIQQEVSSYSTSLWPFIAGVMFLTLILSAPEGLPGLLTRLRRASQADNAKLGVSHE